MVHSKTNLCGLSNNFYENDKFEDRDPSKKFLIQKHVMQSQLVEEPGAWQPRKPIKIFENEKFQESDPSKKFLTQKHTLQPQLVEEGQAGSLENPSGDRSRFQTVASPAASQTPGQRQDKKTGRGQKYEKDRKTKKTERQKKLHV